MTESQPDEKPWIHPTRSMLYHEGVLVGIITDIHVEDMFHWSGRVEFVGNARTKYTPMWDYFIAVAEAYPEHPAEDEPYPFPESFMDNWELEDINGRREILFPHFEEEELFWRD
jgi:hypothetical protein